MIGTAATLLSQAFRDPVNVLVRLGRLLYWSMMGVVTVAWYAEWRNQRVAPGDLTNWPVPGISQLRAQFGAARQDAPLPSAFGGGGGSTGGASGATAGGPVGPSPLFPQGQPFTWGRLDQGVDVDTVPGGKVLAIADGMMGLNPSPDPGGFGAKFPVWQATSGQLRGKTIYYGHVIPALQPGTRFKKGDVIAITSKTGQGNGGPGHLEVGFWPPGPMGSGGNMAPYVGFGGK